MSTPALPLALYKANLDLWLRIGELLEENRSQWMALVAREVDDGAIETSREAEALRRGDWQTLAWLPGEALQRLAEHGLGDLQAAAQTALGNQMTFANGFQQALAEWQQASVEALGGGAAVDVQGDMQALFGQALQDLIAWPETLSGLVPGATPRTPDVAGSGTSATPAARRTAHGVKGTKTARKAAKKTAKKTARKAAKKAAKKAAPAKKAATGRAKKAAGSSAGYAPGRRAAPRKAAAKKAAKKAPRRARK